MGTNFHTAWDISTLFKPTSMDPALASLDKGITYLKNIIVSCRGNIYCDLTAGTLVWDNVIYIYFIKEDGTNTYNYISAGSVALGVNEMAYVDLVEGGGAISVSKGSSSSVSRVGVARVVLAHRDWVGDGVVYPIFPVRLLPRIPRSLESTAQTTNDTVTVLATLALQANTAYLIIAEVVANKSDHTQRAMYIRKALVYRITGDAIVEGSVNDEVESDADWDCTIDANSTNARVRITGKAATTIDWIGKINWVRV